MNWTKQAEEMTQAWANAQKKMWEQWLSLAQNSPESATDAFSQWQTMAKQWTDQAEPTARATAERLLGSQKMLLELFQFAMNAWQDIAAKVAAGQDWQATLGNYTQQFQQQLIKSAEASLKMSHDSAEMWRMYQADMQKVAGPWAAWWQQAPELFARANGVNPAAAGLAGVYQQIYEQTFGQFLNSPTMGLARELEHKLRQGFDVWLANRQADFNYQLLLIGAWSSAFERFQQKLVELTQANTTINTLEELGGVWIDAAESAFVEVFESPAYIDAQAELLNSNMRLRLSQREITELVLKQLDIPTRTEVDEAHRANYQFRKDMKALKKELAAVEQSHAELTDARATIAALKKELAGVTKSNQQLAAALETLKKEVAALKKSTAAAKPAPRKTSTKAKPAAAKPEGES